MPLPCEHESNLVAQVKPAIKLLQELDTAHPEILRKKGINPLDYHGGKVFRSAVESIRGSFISRSKPSREGMIADFLEHSRNLKLIHEYEKTGRGERHDFSVIVDAERKKRIAIEVKGGEGNSINISERPIWADEFIVWSHLDGAIVNQPRDGAGQIIFNRLANEIVKREKRIDALITKDALCGTRTRRCPKYAGTDELPLGVAPCIFLLPRRIPSRDDPKPPTHNVKSIDTPRLILQSHSVPANQWKEHIFYVSIELSYGEGRVYSRNVSVSKKNKIIEQRKSRMRL